MAAASGSGDKIQNTMKVLEDTRLRVPSPRFTAARCWISWWTEGVQIFGGYGFMRSIPSAARTAIRASTVFFEGTKRNQPHADHPDADEARNGRAVAADPGGNEAGG